MTLDDITYRILEKLRPNLSDDDDIDLRLLESEVHSQRALSIRNEYNKNRTIDPFIIQDLGCVEMEIVDRAECCEVDLDCSILRSTLKIPSTVELHNTTPIWIQPVDKLEKSFGHITPEQAKFIKGNRFTKNQVFAFIINGYVYLVSEDDSHAEISHISVRGVFENPVAVAEFNTCEGSACYSSSTVYPMKEWMRNYVEGAVIQNLITKLKHPVDTSNNAKSDPKPIN